MNLEWAVPCQPTGPEAKPEHGLVTPTQAVPGHRLAMPFVLGQPEARFISQKTPHSVSVSYHISDEFDSS
jgi:hypothetical protein